MDFLEYKNYLLANNIHLFDCDYRISYQNAFILNHTIINTNQTGGANIKNDEYFLSPFLVLKRKNEKVIKLLVKNLVESNFHGAKYICENNFTLKNNI